MAGLWKIAVEPVTDSTAEAVRGRREVKLTWDQLRLFLDAAEVGLDGALGWAEDVDVEVAAAARLVLVAGVEAADG